MIKLRKFKSSDVERLVFLASNQNVSRYLTSFFPYPYTQEDAEYWVNEGCNTGITRVIEFKGEFVGAVGAHPKAGEYQRSATIGYWLGEPYWGNGIAAESLSILTGYVFETTNLVRLQASIFSPNKASMSVARKAGYQCEAILRQAIYKNGEFYDEHLYVKLKS